MNQKNYSKKLKYRIRRFLFINLPLFLIVVLSEAFFIQIFLERL